MAEVYKRYPQCSKNDGQLRSQQLEDLFDKLLGLEVPQLVEALDSLLSSRIPNDVANICNEVGSRRNIGLVHRSTFQPITSPSNECDFRELVVSKLPELGFTLVKSQSEFPDWILRTRTGKLVRAEVELHSYSFRTHLHEPSLCDLIFCWEHNWQSCNIPVFEYSSNTYFNSSYDELGASSEYLLMPIARPVKGQHTPKLVARMYHECVKDGATKARACRIVGEHFSLAPKTVREYATSKQYQS